MSKRCSALASPPLGNGLHHIFFSLTLYLPPCLYLQLLVTDILSNPLASANVLVESAQAVASKSVVLSQAPFSLRE